MTAQLALFGETIKNPLCTRWVSCKGVMASVGPKEPRTGSYTERITCMECQKVGERSTRCPAVKS